MRTSEKRPHQCCEICGRPGTWSEQYDGHLCDRHYHKTVYSDPRYAARWERWSNLQILLTALGCTSHDYGEHIMRLAGVSSVLDYVRRMETKQKQRRNK